MNIYETFKICKEYGIDPNKVFMIHLDCDGVKDLGEALGFRIPPRI